MLVPRSDDPKRKEELQRMNEEAKIKGEPQRKVKDAVQIDKPVPASE